VAVFPFSNVFKSLQISSNVFVSLRMSSNVYMAGTARRIFAFVNEKQIISLRF